MENKKTQPSYKYNKKQSFLSTVEQLITTRKALYLTIGLIMCIGIIQFGVRPAVQHSDLRRAYEEASLLVSKSEDSLQRNRRQDDSMQ